MKFEILYNLTNNCMTHRTLEHVIVTIHCGTRDHLLMLTGISYHIKFESEERNTHHTPEH